MAFVLNYATEQKKSNFYVPRLFQLSSKIQVFDYLFVFKKNYF